MNTKVIAITVVAILLVAGCGVGIFFALNNNDNKTLSVDEVRDGVFVGDYYTFAMDRFTVSSDVNIWSEDELLNEFYIKGRDKVGTDEITYNGKTFVCDVNETKSTGLKTWNNEHGVCLQCFYFADGVMREYILYDTNLNVELPRSEQIISVGTDIEYDYSTTASENTVTGKSGYTVSDVLGETFVVNNTTVIIIQNMVTVKVESIKDGMVIYEGSDKSPRTFADFRANISLADFNIWLNEAGLKKETMSKTEMIMNTPYGNREVTMEMFKIIKPDFTSTTYTIAYGKEGFIYYEDLSSLDGNSYSFTEVRLAETSLKK